MNTSDIDFVTFRRKTKTKSCSNLLNSLDESFDQDKSSDYDMLNSTMKTLPNMSMESELILRLRSEIKDLHVQLTSAHVEIENLSIENNKYKNDLESMKRKLMLMNKFSFTLTPKPVSTIKKKL